MKEDSNAVLQGLLDSKKEYNEYLSDCFVESIVRFFQRMYNSCMTKQEYKSGKNILVLFQGQLETVPNFNHSQIVDEFAIVKAHTKCNYIPSLIKAILIAHVKIALLTNYKMVDMNKIKLRVPSAENFYHRCLIVCANELWKQPYLFYHKVRSIEQQHNLNEVEGIAKKAIKNAIRMFLPLDQLLNNIQLSVVSETESEEDIEEDVQPESEDEHDTYKVASEETEDEPESDVESEHQSEDAEDQPDSESEVEVCEQVAEAEETADSFEDVADLDENDDAPSDYTPSTTDDDVKTIQTDDFVEKDDFKSPCNVAKIESDSVVPTTPASNNKTVLLGSTLVNMEKLRRPSALRKMKPVKIKRKDGFF